MSNYDLYFIETIWPSSTKSGFTRYNSTAYNDRRTPGTRTLFSSVVGTFDENNKDVSAVPERVTNGHSGWLRFADVAAFTTARAALNYAERLTEFGEIAAAQGPHGDQYRGPIKVQVVRETMTTTREVLWNSPKPVRDKFDKLTVAECRKITTQHSPEVVRQMLRNLLSEKKP
jgi:hypothetical protein